MCGIAELYSQVSQAFAESAILGRRGPTSPGTFSLTGAWNIVLFPCPCFLNTWYVPLQVYSEQYFLVTMDDLCGIEESEGARRSFLCHRDSPGIFPAQWSLKNGLPLGPPPGTLCWILTPGSKALEQRDRCAARGD